MSHTFGAPNEDQNSRNHNAASELSRLSKHSTGLPAEWKIIETPKLRHHININAILRDEQTFPFYEAIRYTSPLRTH